MMNPTDITVSLETAQALKEAGWEKKTVFVWTVSRKTGNTKVWPSPGFYESDNFAAPTLGELLDSIKINYHASSAQSYWLTPYDSVSPCWEYYDPFIDHSYVRVNTAPTHQDALANLWINHPEIRKSHGKQ